MILILINYIWISSAQYCDYDSVCGCYQYSASAWMPDCTCADVQKEDDCEPDGLFCGASFYSDGTSGGVSACTDQCDVFNMDGYVPAEDGSTSWYDGFQVTLCYTSFADSESS